MAITTHICYTGRLSQGLLPQYFSPAGQTLCALQCDMVTASFAFCSHFDLITYGMAAKRHQLLSVINTVLVSVLRVCSKEMFDGKLPFIPLLLDILGRRSFAHFQLVRCKVNGPRSNTASKPLYAEYPDFDTDTRHQA